MSSFKELVIRNRSYRRFKNDEPLKKEILVNLVNLARLTPSARNAQPLKYYISSDSETNNKIFPHLSWAGYLKEWSGPREDERPAGYIVICGDDEISITVPWDHSIAAQTILLGAVEKGLGGCMIGAFKKKKISSALGLSEKYNPLLVIALGIPSEEVVLEPLADDGDTKYWRDSEDRHHVPKRSLEDIIIN